MLRRARAKHPESPAQCPNRRVVAKAATALVAVVARVVVVASQDSPDPLCNRLA